MTIFQIGPNWKHQILQNDKINATKKLKLTVGKVENIVKNGENDGYKHFLLSHIFKRPLPWGHQKSGLCGKELTHSHTVTPFDAPGKLAFLKTLWEKEKFLLFLQCFLLVWITFCHFHQIWNCHLQSLSIRKSLKFVIW